MREKKDYAFLQPVQIGNRTFKNRIIYPAMGKHLATKDGFVTEEYIEYFRSVARGGVAALVTGIQVIDPTWHYISDLMPEPASMAMEMKLALKAAWADGVKIAYEQKATAVSDGMLTVEGRKTGQIRKTYKHGKQELNFYS